MGSEFAEPEKRPIKKPEGTAPQPWSIPNSPAPVPPAPQQTQAARPKQGVIPDPNRPGHFMFEPRQRESEANESDPSKPQRQRVIPDPNRPGQFMFEPRQRGSGEKALDPNQPQKPRVVPDPNRPGHFMFEERQRKPGATAFDPSQPQGRRMLPDPNNPDGYIFQTGTPEPKKADPQQPASKIAQPESIKTTAKAYISESQESLQQNALSETIAFQPSDLYEGAEQAVKQGVKAAPAAVEKAAPTAIRLAPGIMKVLLKSGGVLLLPLTEGIFAEPVEGAKEAEMVRRNKQQHQHQREESASPQGSTPTTSPVPSPMPVYQPSVQQQSPPIPNAIDQQRQQQQHQATQQAIDAAHRTEQKARQDRLKAEQDIIEAKAKTRQAEAKTKEAEAQTRQANIETQAIYDRMAREQYAEQLIQQAKQQTGSTDVPVLTKPEGMPQPQEKPSDKALPTLPLQPKKPEEQQGSFLPKPLPNVKPKSEGEPAKNDPLQAKPVVSKTEDPVQGAETSAEATSASKSDGKSSKAKGADDKQRAKLQQLQEKRITQEAQRQLVEGIKEAEANGTLDKLRKQKPDDWNWLNADPSGRRKELAFDPDTKSFKVEEAKAALQAEKDGLLDSPLRRAIDERGKSQGGDYIDANGKYWDVKEASAGADRIAKTASTERGNPGENVLVDCSKLTADQQRALEAEIKDKLSTDSAEVRFVGTKKP